MECTCACCVSVCRSCLCMSMKWEFAHQHSFRYVHAPRLATTRNDCCTSGSGQCQRILLVINDHLQLASVASSSGSCGAIFTESTERGLKGP